jgi:hypothetical protein
MVFVYGVLVGSWVTGSFALLVHASFWTIFWDGMPLDMYLLTDVFIQYFMVPVLGRIMIDTLQPQTSQIKPWSKSWIATIPGPTFILAFQCNSAAETKVLLTIECLSIPYVGLVTARHWQSGYSG